MEDIEELEKLHKEIYDVQDEYLKAFEKQTEEENRLSDLIGLYTEEQLEGEDGFVSLELAKFKASMKFREETNKARINDLKLKRLEFDCRRAGDKLLTQRLRIERKTATLEAEKLVEKVEE